jgi:hypothetical protein
MFDGWDEMAIQWILISVQADFSVVVCGKFGQNLLNS